MQRLRQRRRRLQSLWPLGRRDWLCSTAINFASRERNGSVEVGSRVTVRDENGAPVSGATADVSWTLPDGTTRTKSALTNSKGHAFFGVRDPIGEYTLTVDGVTLAGKRFNPLNSILSKLVTVPTEP